ncbi:putative carboxysome-like ethanolaminosome structural protein, ethanolamine utilization protein [[Clostridium] ultunense Esp]|uniref:Putative carboxysome-like ethanolaminosome structural protein, ethanolamine utilization protein n=1 Tax=[Clostridium] ultunense Esp TaxID=1288971 RepID=M1ZLY7_9FIRM|nr:BMC domain-containing protein [Schnuerera ultunensis]CCQ98022.1 putative carboxysome-like ethanolaminosome structural protein, ethanolamine utilization protein [[Clostridium] ultunense Esp]SHD76335.1 putative carboxysome-like ethanolaminosome structural protein, ethanolamine utilization protein [[Clostridium] ultunense Esp]
MKEAIGMVETRSLVGAIQAADAMVKAANVKVLDFQFVGSGLVAVTVTGDVAAVKAAVESGEEEAAKVAEVISTNVIPRPHDEVDKIF